LVNQPSSRQGAFRITRPPPLRFRELRRSRNGKETLSEAKQRPPRRARSSHQEGRQQEKPICEMRVVHGALRMTAVFPRVRSANRPRMTGPAAQTNRMPAAAPSWRQCCEIMRPMEPSCRVTPSPSSRAARSARPARFARQEPFTRRHRSDRESVSSILCLEQLARGETQWENSGAMKLARQHGQISLNNSGRLWCSLRQMHFPQIFSFVGKGADDHAKPINCLYTLDPKARPWADNVILVPIDRIQSNLLVGRRTKSLVLRHHETLERALGYLMDRT
jgi:hypothetical protein